MPEGMQFQRQIPKFLQGMTVARESPAQAKRDNADCGELSDDEEDKRVKAAALKEYMDSGADVNKGNLDADLLDTVKSGQNLALQEQLGVHAFTSKKKRKRDGDDDCDNDAKATSTKQPKTKPTKKRIKSVKDKSKLGFDE